LKATAAAGGPPLWRQLQQVAQTVAAVRGGASGSAALEQVPAGLRPGVQALAFQVLRQLGRAEALRKRLAPRAPAALPDALLCSALALAWQPQEAPYEVFTLVNQAVEAAKRHSATKGQAGFINACLRRFLRERDALVAATDANPVALWNHPTWWIERVKRDHPDHWQQILQANNRHAPMALRVNARQSRVADYVRRLADAGLQGQAFGAQGITLAQPAPVTALPGFAQGMVSVQDAAAQLAAPLLLGGWASEQPLRILDACAAPGGKTAHLLELGNHQVTALEVDGARAERLRQTLQRLDLTADVRVADAGRPQDWWDGQPFDAVLLDAPCTASGIVRRHPDVRWLRRETDIAQLAALQARLLAALWPLVKPGGRLLYCTCSVFRAEGEAQVQTFLAHNTGASLLPSPGHLLPVSAAKPGAVLDNQQGDHDGFFYALLEKNTG
jgi:16S rRNA (cytosine967-C5)-methyltransferase